MPVRCLAPQPWKRQRFDDPAQLPSVIQIRMQIRFHCQAQLDHPMFVKRFRLRRLRAGDAALLNATRLVAGTA